MFILFVFFVLNKVTIPPGVSPGQAILVTAPDGSGRTIMVTVPQGLSPGSTFMAEFPPYTSSSAPSVVASSVASSGPPRPAQVEMGPVDYSKVEILPPPQASAPVEPFAQAVPIGAGPFDTTISAPSTNRQASSPMPATFGQPMFRVQAPPGSASGSTLHVSIPGDNRTISAVPPGNGSSFHFPCESQQQAMPATMVAQSPQPPQKNQKLLLVRVPPGTQPGTTLHVTIPDEPGRIIAATVPANVSEFHVAYQPSNSNDNNGRGLSQPPNNNNGPPRNNYNSNGRNNYSNRNSGGMGSVLLPALGGVALGMAGMGIYDHFHHNNDNVYDESNNTYGDAGNDYGGDDYGGGGDFGDF